MAAKSRTRVKKPKPSSPPPNLYILPTVTTVNPTEITQHLQALLEKSRTGEINSLLAVTTNEEGEVFLTMAEIDDGFRVLGMLEAAAKALAVELTRTEGEDE